MGHFVTLTLCEQLVKTVLRTVQWTQTACPIKDLWNSLWTTLRITGF